MHMSHRRVVTGRDSEGRSFVLSDGAAERAYELEHTPGMSNELIWATDAHQQVLPNLGTAPVDYVPAPGETRVMIVQFPSDSIFAAPGFDPDASGEEQARLLPGLAERFEPDNPGFHRTPTVDYAVVLSGDLWLQLDIGEPVKLSVGDVVIQQATHHAWRNPTATPAVVAFVMVGVSETS